jgi:hypothetical protein
VAGFSLLVLGGAAFLPDQFLFVLGNKYSHLQRELLLMVGGATLNMLASTLWILNASRAWLTGSWLNIPFTLSTQLLMIPFIDFSTVSGVLTFNLFTALPVPYQRCLELSRVSSRRRHEASNFGYHFARWEGNLRRAPTKHCFRQSCKDQFRWRSFPRYPTPKRDASGAGPVHSPLSKKPVI